MILLLQGMTKGDTANPYHRWICISQTKEVISCGQKTKKNDENTHLLYGQMKCHESFKFIDIELLEGETKKHIKRPKFLASKV